MIKPLRLFENSHAWGRQNLRRILIDGSLLAALLACTSWFVHR